MVCTIYGSYRLFNWSQFCSYMVLICLLHGTYMVLMGFLYGTHMIHKSSRMASTWFFQGSSLKSCSHIVFYMAPTWFFHDSIIVHGSSLALRCFLHCSFKFLDDIFSFQSIIINCFKIFCAMLLWLFGHLYDCQIIINWLWYSCQERFMGSTRVVHWCSYLIFIFYICAYHCHNFSWCRTYLLFYFLLLIKAVEFRSYVLFVLW